MNNRLKLLFRPENIPLILAILVSLGFLAYDVFQPNPSTDTKIIVVVLGTLAFGLLAERLGYFERIEHGIDEIRNQKKTFLHIPVTWTDFEAYCSSAKEVFISGGSLAGLVPRYRPLFEQMAKKGCKLRFVLLNPASPSLPAIARWAGAPPERFKSEIQVSLAHLQELIATYGRNVEVRLNNAIPALTVMGFNPEGLDGRIRVDLNLYQCPPARRLYFELTRTPNNAEEEGWYQGFLAQFEMLWHQSDNLPNQKP